jgi:mRNA-degrading endonuclease RelE of RelBE toxin-antitoxin system
MRKIFGKDDFYSARQGEHRIAYSINNSAHLVEVVKSRLAE